MVNAKHDTQPYEATRLPGERGYMREIYDGNALYDAFKKARKDSDWKPQVQNFEMNLLFELAKMQEQLANQTYQFHPASNFVLRERGKNRRISGEQIPDRIVKHALCDEVVNPAVRKYLIYDNGASLEGKGIDFTRKRLLTHLRRYYRLHGNEGYILLMDFSKYYDNIRHEKLMEVFKKCAKNDYALWLLEMTIARSKVDVSYMTEEEYAHCMETLFNSLVYEQIDSALLTGEKYMEKHLNIGDQVAQTAGIVYPIELDNYIKIVLGVKFYGRYMDDSYILHPDKDYLKSLLADITGRAADIGITVNQKKTRICKISDLWRFLQVQYSLTDTGRVIQKINPKRLHTMRRKMKKLAPQMTEKAFTDWYKSWMQSYHRLMSKQQRDNIDILFFELKEETIHVETDSCGRDGADRLYLKWE